MRLFVFALAMMVLLRCSEGLLDAQPLRGAEGPILDPAKEEHLAAYKCVEGARASSRRIAANFARDYVVLHCSCGVRCQWLLVWGVESGRLIEGLPSFSLISATGRKYPGARYSLSRTSLEVEACFGEAETKREPCGKRTYALDPAVGRFREQGEMRKTVK